MQKRKTRFASNGEPILWQWEKIITKAQGSKNIKLLFKKLFYRGMDKEDMVDSYSEILLRH